jgi:hypothetical protein
MRSHNIPFLLLLALAVFISSCKKEQEEDDLIETPSAAAVCESGDYCFERNGATTVSFSGQTARLNQLEELTSYMKTGNTSGVSVSAAQLKEMFSNADGAGSDFFTDAAKVPGKELKNKCFLPNVGLYEQYMDQLEAASQSTTAGENGIAGVVVSINDPSKAYLFDEFGFEHIQLIEKGLIGDVFYYQACDTYLQGVLDEVYDNSALIDGKNYREMEHKFDEAFGYFGIPINFPNTSGEARFHGKYCEGRDAALGTNAIFDDFLSARTAITQNTSLNQDAFTPIDDIKLKWHRVIAGTVVYYLKVAKENMDDPAIKNHVLSEAYAFMGNLLHNQGYQWSVDELEDGRNLLGNNFYETTEEDIDACLEFMLDNTEITLVELANL